MPGSALDPEEPEMNQIQTVLCLVEPPVKWGREKRSQSISIIDIDIDININDQSKKGLINKMSCWMVVRDD